MGDSRFDGVMNAGNNEIGVGGFAAEKLRWEPRNKRDGTVGGIGEWWDNEEDRI